MILVTEKKVVDSKEHKEKFAFRDIARALRYAADWVDIHQKDCLVVAETWRNKVKFGFEAYHENGDRDELSLEDIQDADPG